jgi:hypothetical protein
VRPKKLPVWSTMLLNGEVFVCLELLSVEIEGNLLWTLVSFFVSFSMRRRQVGSSPGLGACMYRNRLWRSWSGFMRYRFPALTTYWHSHMSCFIGTELTCSVSRTNKRSAFRTRCLHIRRSLLCRSSVIVQLDGMLSGIGISRYI